MNALWLAALVLPLTLAVLLGVGGMRRWALALAPWSIPPVLALALFPPAPLYLDGVLLGVHLGSDPVGEVMLLLVGLLWWLAALQAQASMARDPAQARFFVFFLLTFVGNAGLVMAQDGISFYLFFTLMTFAAYGLIVHRGDAQAREAGRIYLILALIGEAVLLAGLMMAVAAAGEAGFAALRAAVAEAPHRDLIIGLLVFGFGIKAGMIPLHVWLPLAHPAAPAPASAVLSGTIIKGGLLGWLRFLPLGETTLPEWGVLFIGLGLLAAFYGVLIGLMQRELKVVLAYSSISQMGLMTIGVGLVCLAPQHAPALLWALLLYALHHGLAKGALFMGVTMAGPLPRARGARALVLAGLALPALALAGAPLTSGAVAKAWLKEGVDLADGASGLAVWSALDLPLGLSLAALGTTLLMARFLWLVAGKARGVAPSQGVWVPWALALVLVAGVAWVVALLGPAPLTAPGAMGAGWSSLWPVLGGMLGAGVALAVTRAAPRTRLPLVPAGDLLVPVQRALAPLHAVSLDVPRRRIHAFGVLLQRRIRARVLGTAALVERRLSRWRSPATLVLLMVLALWLAIGKLL